MMSNRRAALLCIVLLATTLLTPVAAVAQEGETERDAELEVRQPHYIDEDVKETRDEGVKVYTANSGHLELYSRQWSHEDVTDYGVEPSGASLSYDSTTGGYTLETSANGTHEVYWVVLEEYDVEEERGNETVTTTKTERVTYTAQIRVGDTQEAMVVDASQYREYQEKADKWDDAISQAEQHAEADYLLQFSPVTAEDVIYLGLDAYRTTRSPMSWFTGGATAYFVLIISSLGALAVFVVKMGYHTVIVAMLYRKLNIFEVTESHEGTVAERTETMEKRESEQALQNEAFNDIWSHDDQVAAAFREMGENPHTAFKNFTANVLTPSRAAAEKIRAMGQCGYKGLIEDGTAPDGGDGSGDIDELDIQKARIVEADAVNDDAPTFDLTKVTPELARSAFDLNSDVLTEWRPSEHDSDAEAASVPDENLTVNELVAEAQLDERHFDSEQAAGTYIREFLEHVRAHPYTQEDGTPDTTRAVLNEWLRAAQYLRDRYDYPVTQFQIDAVEQALINYDPQAEAEQTLSDVKQGKYA